MPETPPIHSPESDLARGLAEFRQGRKSLLPEFELPTDDIPKEEQLEIPMERIVAVAYQKLWDQLNIEQELNDPIYLDKLIEGINYYLEGGDVFGWAKRLVCLLHSIRSLDIELPKEIQEKINHKIIDPDFFYQLHQELRHCLEIGGPHNSKYAVDIVFYIKSLMLDLPYISTDIIKPRILSSVESFFRFKTINYGKKSDVSPVQPVEAIYYTHALGLKLPNLSLDEGIQTIIDPKFISEIVRHLLKDFTFGKNNPTQACLNAQHAATIQGVIKYFSSMADQKEGQQAAHRLQTAADRTGVPPRPETKAF